MSETKHKGPVGIERELMDWANDPLSSANRPNMKHTPGPWTLETVRTQVGVCHKIGKLGSTTKLNYACLYDDCHSAEPRDLQLLADAKLIVAAPALLEACKIAAAELSGRTSLGITTIAEKTLRAAISQAEGKSNG